MIFDKFINNIGVFLLREFLRKTFYPKLITWRFMKKKKAENFVYSVKKNIFLVISSKIIKRAL